MTLKEAAQEYHSWVSVFIESDLNSQTYHESDKKCTELAELIMFLKKSPTAQLCAVAQQLNGDTE